MKCKSAEIIPFPGADQPLEIKLAELADIISDLQSLHGLKADIVVEAVTNILDWPEATTCREMKG